MDAPPIQFTRSADGVAIAYTQAGAGEPILYLHDGPWSHVEREWEIGVWRRGYEQLLERHQLVRLDERGYGLSGRDTEDFTVEARLGDVTAVLDALGIDQVVLWGRMQATPLIMAFAARFPSRVSHLLLTDPYARTADWVAIPAVRHVVTTQSMAGRCLTSSTSVLIPPDIPGSSGCWRLR